MIDWVVNWVIDWVVYWVIDWVVYGMIEWSVEWLNDCIWLIDYELRIDILINSLFTILTSHSTQWNRPHWQLWECSGGISYFHIHLLYTSTNPFPFFIMHYLLSSSIIYHSLLLPFCYRFHPRFTQCGRWYSSRYDDYDWNHWTRVSWFSWVLYIVYLSTHCLRLFY